MKKSKKNLKVKKYSFAEETKSRRLSTKDKQTLGLVVVILLILTAVFIIANFKSKKSQDEQAAEALSVPTAVITEYPITEADESTQSKTPDYLQAYLEQNFNTVGYIKIEDTSIDYPVVQVDNNEYYIDHNFEGEKDASGAIFMDFRCDINDFSKTRNIILYGHRMKNGTQFKDLTKYEDVDFFRVHRYIYFDTINEYLAWEVFAVFETTTDDYYIETIFPYDEQWIDFLEQHYKKSLHYVYMNFYADDIVLTLSTCSAKENGRLVVMAKLVK